MNNPVLFVASIFPEKRDIPSVLGITEERLETLSRLVADLLSKDEHPTITEKMEEISKECVHANELAYACYALGHAACHAEFMSRFIGGR